MRRRRAFSAIGVALAAGTALHALPAGAQDPMGADAAHHRIEFENEQMRILRFTLAPGEKSVMHEHPCTVVIALTDIDLVVGLPDGREVPARMPQGQVRAMKPAVHQPENRSGRDVQVLLVEMKQGGC